MKKHEVEVLSETLGYIKVNIPSDLDSYESGNGEGCWAVPATQEDKDIYDREGDKEHFNVLLANSSVYYPHLSYGSMLVAETRGTEYRAVAVWDKLTNTEDAPSKKTGL